MTTLHFGVIDLPYSFSIDLGKTKSGKQRASTTGDVAEILEDKYGIMQYFWDLHGKEIVECIEDGLEGAFESLLMGASVSENLFADATSKIEIIFQKFLDSKEMDGKINGVPTMASLMGVSHRFKKKRNKGKGGKTPGTPRPSFIDTGLYQSSFKCWVES